jgi:hypothetical protein
MRKKRIVPYLHALLKNVDYAHEMRILLQQLEGNNKTRDSTREVIQSHFLSLFTRGLIGTEFPKPLQDLLNRNNTYFLAVFQALPLWTRKLLPFIPYVRNMRATYHAAIRDFLITQITAIKQHTEIKKNWLTDILLEKVKDIRLISDAEIKALADDPEIRMCIAIVLGTKNLLEIITPLLTFIKSETDDRSRLLFEIHSQSVANHADPTYLLDKQKMPLLHATYLEALRFGSKTVIVRRIKESIQVDDVHIPGNSVVVFPLSAFSRMGSEKYPNFFFAPNRFLTEEGQLRNDIKLHEGFFVPFGVGVRMCPGHMTAELMIKIYLVTLLNSAKYFFEKKVEFYDEKNGDTAKAAARNLLKRTIKDQFLFVPRGGEILETIDNITENIARYCL